MHRPSRWLALVPAITLPLIALAGCTGSSSSKGPVTITLVSDGAAPNAKATRAVIALFEKSHPNIKVSFDPDTSTARSQSVLRIGEGDPTLDIASAEVGYQYEWYANGWITPVTKYFTKAELNTVVPHVIDEWTNAQGQLLGVPTDNSGMWLAVNQNLLKEAGVTPPPTMKRDSLSQVTSGVWTWEQVTAAAKKVQEKTGKAGLILPTDDAWPILPLAEQVGAKVTSPGGLQVQGYLNAAPWTTALTKYKNLFAGGATQIANPQWSNATFLAGNAAFQLSHLAVFNECTTVKFDCDAAAEPYFQGGKKVVPSSNSGWVLNSKSTHKAQAAEFMKFVLLTPAASKILVQSPFFAGVPMLKTPFNALVASAAGKKFPESVKVLGMWQSENWPETTVRSPVGATFFTAFTTAFGAVRTGAETPQQADAQMVSTVERQLKKYQG